MSKKHIKVRQNIEAKKERQKGVRFMVRVLGGKRNDYKARTRYSG